VLSIVLARLGSILSFPLLLLDQVVFLLPIALESNGKDKILPDLARAMEKIKYYLI
jgi:hypothetical protein